MISRRRMLIASGLAGSMALWSRWLLGAPASASASTARQISLSNLHTGERLKVEYFRDDAYVSDALNAIEVLLRDFRNGEKHAIDPKLMDYLVDVAARIGVPPAYVVISGYRSPETNERLHERSSGVSQHSLHMQGRAIDVRMNGVDCKDLAAHAEQLKRGGVGFYRASNFVHLDTGAFRTWRG
ncbi:MAG TPA: DUF882 domain-containing protein [Steroidobacteraceae bacterium]|jgi:uncharacterized protein YcbK (DUF882 family)|nr:DUF882 domain-containing protein [Steroidobacteraceae bacterium]